MSSPDPGPLDPRFRFDTFVPGQANELAFAAAIAVAAAPARSYNPLLLSGGIGLGKTHLLQAIGHAIRTRLPDLRVLFLDAGQLVHEMVLAIRFDRLAAFRERYGAIDVLLIDDIQFLADRERTQEEFLHTLEELHARRKQIVLASVVPPRGIPLLEQRLRSRFPGGLALEIHPPDRDTRRAILRRKAELAGLHLPEDLIDLIARQERYNIREMEGLVHRVTAYASLTGQPLTSDLGYESLKGIVDD